MPASSSCSTTSRSSPCAPGRSPATRRSSVGSTPTAACSAPQGFIPLAEETGLIIPIGNWVLETACRQARQLQDRFPRPQPLTMAVNLSARQLQWSGLVAEVKRIVAETDIAADTVTIEVTESTMIEDVELAVRRLAELRALGLRVAIDDFGAGYSSLNYIRRLPVDVLKIDKSFIDHIDRGEEQLALTAAIIDMARVLSLATVAEGVERATQLERLVTLGCNHAQGYYFAKPAPSSTIERALAEQAHRSRLEAWPSYRDVTTTLALAVMPELSVTLAVSVYLTPR